MSRIAENRPGYTGFTCNCDLPVGCWTPPDYPPMNGEGCTAPGSNRYLNTPAALKGESISGNVKNWTEFHDLKEYIEPHYFPSGQDPDPFTGDYLNLYQIIKESSEILPIGDRVFNPDDLYNPTWPGAGSPGLFDHICYEIEECIQPEYDEGYLDVPVPFIAFSDAGASDPGMTGVVAVKDITGITVSSSEICIEYTQVEYSRQSGVASVSEVDQAADPTCTTEVTDCPPGT